ncbi:MAG: hypothetical protein D6732_20600 [Methanobacteriota archaeon]|nr:MAG: hypothetical protein D6732_20600 [Euryarchaeota archaeon]
MKHQGQDLLFGILSDTIKSISILSNFYTEQKEDRIPKKKIMEKIQLHPSFSALSKSAQVIVIF